ncbi:unnamed protein product [Rotaria sp. Silwood1]|nr:unnamed protein product [Rotaria sp. Silwood1]CAF0917752.1 unnamed protein product [Rotaria sp. Silwood1]CAF0944075.1 unnamed protein product [Rotaria sp. Silwood1]CAF3359870.1 unnamed protein product [Rotaria sp. Silwood1]CAF3383364.1 unnamed protein product [Rotaria sp. Silwood1]
MVESSPLVDPVAVKTSSEPIPNKSQGSFTDHLANERTFLAWIRTGLGIFAFGCAIAKFGGSDNIQKTFKNSFHEMKPIISGLVLVAAGILILFYSIYRYYRINRQIIRRDLSEVSQIREPIIATLVLLLCMFAILIIFVIL